MEDQWEKWWENHFKSWRLGPGNESAEEEAFRSMEDGLEEIQEFQTKSYKVLLLGLPSLQEQDDGDGPDAPWRQHIFALLMTKYYIGRLWRNWGNHNEVQLPEIYIDNSLLTRDDCELLKAKYQPTECYSLHITNIADIFNRNIPPVRWFVITFNSKNPIRQILADILLAGLQLWGPHLALPQAMICVIRIAEKSPKDSDVVARDRYSTRV
jgi:hypothetical protein